MVFSNLKASVIVLVKQNKAVVKSVDCSFLTYATPVDIVNEQTAVLTMRAQRYTCRHFERFFAFVSLPSLCPIFRWQVLLEWIFLPDHCLFSSLKSS